MLTCNGSSALAAGTTTGRSRWGPLRPANDARDGFTHMYPPGHRGRSDVSRDGWHGLIGGGCSAYGLAENATGGRGISLPQHHGSRIVFWLICGVIAAAIGSGKEPQCFWMVVLGPLFAPSVLIVVAIPITSKSTFPTPGGESSWLVENLERPMWKRIVCFVVALGFAVLITHTTIRHRPRRHMTAPPPRPWLRLQRLRLHAPRWSKNSSA